MSNNNLVNNLNIPDYTKQFVYVIQDPQTKSTIYILYVHGLSEKSASDTESLIRAVQPDAVISDWSWAYTPAHDFGDSPNKPIPTSLFSVMKQCLLYKTNKYRYQSVARNCLLQEIFGVGYETHHFVANKISEEIGACFLMGSPRYFKLQPIEVNKQGDFYNEPLFALAGVQKLLLDVEKGRNVETRDLTRVYSFRNAVEALRLNKYREGRNRDVHKTAETELSGEEQSQYLAAQGIREQAKKFKKIVVITGQDDWTSIEKFWNFPVFQETKGMTGKLYVSREESGVELSSLLENDRLERRPVSLVAAETASLVASVLFRKKLGHVFKFIREEKRAIIPWFGFAGFATLLQYSDAIVSVPAAPSIARLGRGIQSLQQASRTIRHPNGNGPCIHEP
ncbi:uncharacterized protein LOC141649947 [Silene latifolia]|uniref:uncharacterized protein LOC141649947 n=1 Tax=Silene latifolia TaxID=37657 RepID=UPI003D779BD9